VALGAFAGAAASSVRRAARRRISQRLIGSGVSQLKVAVGDIRGATTRGMAAGLEGR